MQDAKAEGQGEGASYSQLKVAATDIKTTIFGHPEFTTFNQQITKLFASWKSTNAELLAGIKPGDRPKALIENLSESLLHSFQKTALLDAYDVYQHLMDYWAATMQDDAYMIVSEGWLAQVKTSAGLMQPNTDLIPRDLIIRRYFEKNASAIEQLETLRDGYARQLEELDEEHGGEEGLLNEARNEKGRVTAKGVKDRLKQIKKDKAAADERELLDKYLALMDEEATAGKAVKDAQKALEAKVTAHYAVLSEADIKILVIEDKWLAALTQDVQSELDRISQALTGRVRELAERYAVPLPQLTAEVELLSVKVEGHLRRMGFAV